MAQDSNHRCEVTDEEDTENLFPIAQGKNKATRSPGRENTGPNRNPASGSPLMDRR
ncbi:MAG: hypothetical protein ABSA10_03105 [Anaerolineales bacterium]